MAFFKPRSTFKEPAAPSQTQRGFPAPGTTYQFSGEPSQDFGRPVAQVPQRPTKGLFSWLAPLFDAGPQRGFPAPEAPNQSRPDGSMPNIPPVFGGVAYNWTPYYDRGAEAWVPITGKVLTNPIGAGVVAQHRPQASYGPSGQFIDNAIWWTSQVIPTSVNLQGLYSADQMAGFLNSLEVQAVVRTTG